MSFPWELSTPDEALTDKLFRNDPLQYVMEMVIPLMATLFYVFARDGRLYISEDPTIESSISAIAGAGFSLEPEIKKELTSRLQSIWDHWYCEPTEIISNLLDAAHAGRGQILNASTPRQILKHLIESESP